MRFNVAPNPDSSLSREQWHRISVDQSSTERKIDCIDSNTKELGKVFIELLEKSKKRQHDDAYECLRWREDRITAIRDDDRPVDARGCTFGNVNAARDEETCNQTLNSLFFPEMHDRRDRIAEAYSKTFQWIFEPRHGDIRCVNFVEWLRGETSLYWITGKAGSGKSTLMKYLHNDPRTLDYLVAWTKDVPLIMPAVFLWNSGSNLQFSQAGLLQSLLYQILVKFPHLIPLALPQRWEVYRLFGYERLEWNIPELGRAFKLLACEQSLQAKICFFIDGLDEFDGAHTDLVNFCKDLTASKSFKVCVASRPWIVFEDGFKSEPSLMLQNLTYADIKHFIDSKFPGNANFLELEEREP